MFQQHLEVQVCLLNSMSFGDFGNFGMRSLVSFCHLRCLVILVGVWSSNFPFGCMVATKNWHPFLENCVCFLCNSAKAKRILDDN